MQLTIAKLFAVKRKLTIEVLFYCPSCEATNEVGGAQLLNDLQCRECHALLTAEHAQVEAINPPAAEQ